MWSIRKYLYPVAIKAASKLNFAFSPRTINFEVSRNCNLSCVMCPSRFTDDKNLNLSPDKFAFIIERFPALRHTIMVGRGETLMNPAVYDFFKIPRLTHTIVTNGTLLTEDNINKLNNVVNVVASIDSPDPAIYKSIRNTDLERVKSNLKNLKKIRKDIKLGIQAVIMKDASSSFERFPAFCSEVNADYLYLISPYGFGKELGEQHPLQISDLKEKLESIAMEMRKRKIEFSATPLLKDNRKCYEPWITPRISLEGDVYPCCFIFNSSTDSWDEWCFGSKFTVNQKGYFIGNIYDLPVNQIWNSENYHLVRRSVRGANRKRLSMDVLKENLLQGKVGGKFAYCHSCLWRHNLSC